MLEIRKREDAAAVFSMPLPASAAGPGAIWRMGGGGGRRKDLSLILTLNSKLHNSSQVR